MKVTPVGVRYLLLSLAVGLAAVNTGNNMLYLVLGMMLSLIVLSGVLSDLVLWSVRDMNSLSVPASARPVAP